MSVGQLEFLFQQCFPWFIFLSKWTHKVSVRVGWIHDWFLFKNNEKDFCYGFSSSFWSSFPHLGLVFEEFSLNLTSDLIYSCTKQRFPEFERYESEECNLLLVFLGNMNQNQRLDAMAKLKQFHCRVLISTDLVSWCFIAYMSVADKVISEN